MRATRRWRTTGPMSVMRPIFAPSTPGFWITGSAPTRSRSSEATSARAFRLSFEAREQERQMIRIVAAAVAAAVLVLPFSIHAQQDSDEAKRLRDAWAVFDEIMKAEDNAIPSAILANAEGVAIFPGTVRAGFIVGGLRGRGVLSVKGDGGWSPPAFLTLTGGSF